MWIDGPQNVMNEKRTWPRFVPRAGNDITVTFGELVDTDRVFGPFRQRWREMKERAQRKRFACLPEGDAAFDLSKEEIGELYNDELRYGAEAEQLRIDVTLAVRNEVLKVRRACGLPDEDPKRGLAETFRVEGGKEGEREREKDDGSVVRDG